MSGVALFIALLAQEGNRVPATVTIPPVDRNVPAVVETATFALG